MTIATYTPGLLRLGPHTWRAVHGHGGIRADKREGDGATPTGTLPLRRVLYRADRGRAPQCAVPTEPLAPTDGWCDAPADPAYNRPVRLPYDASHENLWRTDAIYDIIGILGWNDAPTHPGRGSAIFLHIAQPDWRPTEGCIALAEPDLRAALAAGLTAITVERG